MFCTVIIPDGTKAARSKRAFTCNFVGSNRILQVTINEALIQRPEKAEMSKNQFSNDFRSSGSGLSDGSCAGITIFEAGVFTHFFEIGLSRSFMILACSVLLLRFKSIALLSLSRLAVWRICSGVWCGSRSSKFSMLSITVMIFVIEAG